MTNDVELSNLTSVIAVEALRLRQFTKVEAAEYVAIMNECIDFI